MSKINITEVCPQCGAENEMMWDFKEYGLNAFCPVCGTQMLLCDECMHRDEFDSSCAACNNGHCKHFEDVSKRKYNFVKDGGPYYDVEVIEILRTRVPVKADTVEEAENLVSSRCENGKIVLEKKNFDSRTVTAITKRNKSNRCASIKVFLDNEIVDIVFANFDDVASVCDAIKEEVKTTDDFMGKLKELRGKEWDSEVAPTVAFEIDDDGPDNYDEVNVCDTVDGSKPYDYPTKEDLLLELF